ncbi:hypothetical protein OF83DRAFT_1109077 [Amylostereum chailletii]|nr:hypothetical protein OF83DRAFT_1109077 [Amylostereum chailletii]
MMIFESLGAVARLCIDDGASAKAVDRMNAFSTELWTRLWTDHVRLLPKGRIVKKEDGGLVWSLSWMMYYFRKISVDRNRCPVRPGSKFAHLAILAWFHLTEVNDCQTAMENASYIIEARDSRLISFSEFGPMAKEIIDTFGAEPFLQRFIKDLQNTQLPKEHVYLDISLFGLMYEHSPDFQRLYGPLDVVGYVVDTLGRIGKTTSSPEGQWELFTYADLTLGCV